MRPKLECPDWLNPRAITRVALAAALALGAGCAAGRTTTPKCDSLLASQGLCPDAAPRSTPAAPPVPTPPPPPPRLRTEPARRARPAVAPPPSPETPQGAAPAPSAPPPPDSIKPELVHVSGNIDIISAQGRRQDLSNVQLSHDSIEHPVFGVIRGADIIKFLVSERIRLPHKNELYLVSDHAFADVTVEPDSVLADRIKAWLQPGPKGPGMIFCPLAANGDIGQCILGRLPDEFDVDDSVILRLYYKATVLGDLRAADPVYAVFVSPRSSEGR